MVQFLFRYRFQEKLCLEQIVVRPDYRNLGHGKAMLDWGEKLAREDWVGVGLLCSEALLPYFQKHSFRAVGEFPVPRDGSDQGFTYKWCVLQSRKQLKAVRRTLVAGKKQGTAIKKAIQGWQSRGQKSTKVQKPTQDQKSDQDKPPAQGKKLQQGTSIEWDV